MRSFEPFHYTFNLKEHQVLNEGDIVNENGVRLKLIQNVSGTFDTSDDRYEVTFLVRELPSEDEKAVGENE